MGTWTGWIALGLAVWLVVAVLVGLLIGRVVRDRDRQVPQDDQGEGDARPPGRSDGGGVGGIGGNGGSPTTPERKAPRRAR